MNLKFFFYRSTKFCKVKVDELKSHTTISVKDKQLAAIQLK